MKTETEELFDAPWEVLADVSKDGYTFLEIYDRFRDRIAGQIDEQEIANRLVRLPELYDSLLDAVNDACGACAMMHIQDGYDFVTNGCPFEENEDCKCLKWISVLRKVRNAE